MASLGMDVHSDGVRYPFVLVFRCSHMFIRTQDAVWKGYPQLQTGKEELSILAAVILTLFWPFSLSHIPTSSAHASYVSCLHVLLAERLAKSSSILFLTFDVPSRRTLGSNPVLLTHD